jgi:SNF2 family DNA or RNA helicase
MAKLEDLSRGAAVRGILPDCLVTVVDVKWYGSAAIELTYKDQSGKPNVLLLYRDREPTIEVVDAGSPWSFDGDGKLFRLVSEAHRINLAHLFDPLLAIHTSMVDPLPHQITAVYGQMLPRQPLRFLLADDPGAGKTIMAGLLIKELLIRGDLHRCMIVCPGNLAEQWQDELYQRFQLPFEILTNDKLESARTGNWFAENHLAICRLDKLSRNEDVQAKLANTDWDLIVCDEAHKMSATFFGSEIKYTKRYRLGQLLGQITRHLLLMTATPHNGKPEDFQLFMALLDSDRFEGRARDGVHTVDASDLMRRLVKEQLLKFDGKPLFPERRAYTVGYKLSDAEATLYKTVTDYVREEFNRADSLGEPLPEDLKERLPQLLDQGIIERIGRGRGVRFILSRKFHSFLGQGGAYTRRKGLDRETNKALLYKHIQENKGTGSAFRDLEQVLPALSRNQVQKLLQELKAEGRIRLTGSKRGGRWVPEEQSYAPQ